VRLAGAEEHGDLFEVGGFGSFKAVNVGTEGAQRDSAGTEDMFAEVVGVGELWDPLGGNEARDLDTSKASGHERVDQAQLLAQGDREALVLETVARRDFVKGNSIGKLFEEAHAAEGSPDSMPRQAIAK
jgi:hypothetical protein